jgi:hypothetical protein
MTAVRVLTSKWVLVLGAVAILGLTASQTLADPPGGGHYRSSPGWSSGRSGGYGHEVMPFRGERFGESRRPHHFESPAVISRPDFYRPQWGGGYSRPVCGGYACGTYNAGGMTITIVIR